ncbi:MAG: hypothetical protein JNL96_09835 [Planctomycetaceae bacterium]|nr:hypothetical protein [Planctomycetaceae bacterium]
MKPERGPRRRRVSKDDEPRNVLRSDGSHAERGSKSRAAPAAVDELRDSPAATLPLGDRALLERFEELDDVVFEAIAGKQSAVERLRKLWPAALGAVDRSLAEESRQAYMQHALNKWHECTEHGSARNPRLAVALLDVLCILAVGERPAA